jgi:ribosome-associated protein
MDFDSPIPDNRILVTSALTLSAAEVHYRTSRSSGPGGQHVNKTETRVELLFDVAGSPALTEEQRAFLLAELHPWLDTSGILHLVSERHRSQFRNRQDVLERFIALLAHALRPRTVRKPSRVPRGVREQRLRTKKHRASIKRQRSQRGED